jgi:hypothetical protein
LATEPAQQNLGEAISEVTERMSVLVREEIELAKTEVSEKVTKLIKGAVVGIAAGIFAVTALLFALHGFAWLSWYYIVPDGKLDYFWGYFIVASVLLLLGALAGFLAAKALKAGSPPTPQLAIEEAKKIRETVTTSGAP